MEPIWKDYYVTLANTAVSGGVLYRISWNGTVIFQGRAFARPGENSIKAKINDIVADNITANFSGWGAYGPTAIVSDLYPYVTEVYDPDFDEWNQKDSTVFTPDWSYLDGYLPATDGYNFPVLDTVIAGQLLPIISAPGTDPTITINNSDGTHVTDDWTGDEPSENLMTWLDLAGYPKAESIEMDATLIKSAPTLKVLGCGQFVLYYVNAYGYWDWFPILGKTEEADALTRHTREIDYNNRASYNRAKWNYSNELKHQYIFHTNPLTEAQSLRMHHLLNSPLVYLHDIAAQTIWPVVLTATKTEYKRGNKLYQYTINADLAQNRERR